MKFYKDFQKKKHRFATPDNFKSRLEVWSVGFNFSSVFGVHVWPKYNEYYTEKTYLLPRNFMLKLVLVIIGGESLSSKDRIIKR